MRSKVLGWLVGFCFAVIAVSVFGDETKPESPVSKFSGYAFVDYFNNLKATDAKSVGLNGFQMRRIYFTYDYAVKPNYKARFRIEANDGSLLLLPSAISGARFDKDRITGLNLSASVFSVFVKDAYVQWDITSKALERLHPSVIVGIQPTPAYGGIEEEIAWRYRSLEKTILDRDKIVASRDLGFGLKGAFDKDKRLGYWLLVGNDTTSPELNKQKRFYGLVSYQGNLVLGELYGDVRQQKDAKNETVVKGLIGVQQGAFALTGVVFDRWKKNARQNDPTTLASSGASLFGRYAISKTVEAVVRGDWFDPDTAVEEDASLFAVIGLAYHPIKDVDFIPNVVIEQPEKSGSDPTVVARLTAHFRF